LKLLGRKLVVDRGMRGSWGRGGATSPAYAGSNRAGTPSWQYWFYSEKLKKIQEFRKEKGEERKEDFVNNSSLCL
jgi:hypothetical protein